MRTAHALIFMAAGAACLIPLRRASAEIDYTAGQGWSTEGESTEATASAQLTKAEALEKSGDFHRAMIAYYSLARKFPRSGVAADAQLKAGDMALASADLDRAYALYNEYLSKYPKGDGFDQALKGQFDVGQKFLEGARRRVFGVKAFPSMTRAQQIFESIVKAAPFSKWAPLAQFYAGQSLEKQGQPEEAIAAYEEVISRYPTDPMAADAQYQIGFVYYTQSRTAYDKSAANKAEDAFNDFLARYPNSEKAPQARDDLKTLQSRENSGAMNIAKYYDKRKDYKAAVIYYDEVIKDEPGTPDATTAQARIASLRSTVGDAALDSGPEKAETGAHAQDRRRLQAQVDTASRPDYLGPPVAEPTPPPVADQTPPPKPAMRTSPDDLAPVPPVEPALPQQ
jgi:outer membrane protein assembly factor BamD